MIEDLKRYTDFLVEHNITPNQFYLCFILYLDGERKPNGKKVYYQSGAAIANLYKAVHHNKKLESGDPARFLWSDTDVRHLQEVGFISGDSVVDGPNGTVPDQLYVTPKFVSAIFALDTDFEEFWNAYPAFTKNFNDVRKGEIPLRAVNKEELQRLYKAKIKTRVQHSHLMEGLNYALYLDEINMRIDKFLSSEIWLAFLERKYKDKEEANRMGMKTIAYEE